MRSGQPGNTLARLLPLLALQLFTASACGNGGGGGEGGIGGSGGSGGTGGLGRGGIREGFLIGGPVSGVSYESATQKGVTDEQGRFFYQNGETLTFRVGSVLLGSTKGKEQISAIDLVPEATVVVRTSRIVEALQKEGGPFQRVVNLAVFVQSLDADGEPENGVEIRPEVAALFDDTEVDFTLPSSDFVRQFSLRRRLGRANAEGLFDRPHGTTNPARTMKHFYETLEVDPLMFGPETVAVDFDIDGSVDQQLQYDYDDQGRLVELIEPHRTTGWSYDANWNLMELSVERPGNPTLLTSFTYDVLGNTASEVYTVGGVLSRSEHWEYDESGSLIRYERDEDGDGTAERIESWTYDSKGRPLFFYVGEPVDDANPFRTYTYDDGLRTVTIETDSARDGPENNRIEIREHDENDRLIRLVVDSNVSDGVVDSATAFSYDAAGNLVLEANENSEGMPFRRTYTYDENGNEILVETDEGADGDIDEMRSQTYDAAGRQTLYEADDNADGMVDVRTIQEYDKEGNRVRFVRDAPAGGDPELEVISVYDSLGNEIEYRRTITFSGVPLSRVRTFTRGGWLLAFDQGLVKFYEGFPNLL